MLHGNCLCGKVEFELQEIPGMVFNCHCSRCRRSHGAAYATQVICQKDSLKFLAGEEFVSKFETADIVRTFCAACGSRLVNYGKGDSQYMSVSIAAVNGRTDLKPVGECFAPAKLNFVQLDSSIPHYQELPS